MYGGTGKAARNWEAYDAIVRTLRTLGDDETMLVQSGKPVGGIPTTRRRRGCSSRTRSSCRSGRMETFRELEHEGLTMYGQMTAGSWITSGRRGSSRARTRRSPRRDAALRGRSRGRFA